MAVEKSGNGSAVGCRRTASGWVVADDALGLIGGTPLVCLTKLSPERGATIWAKCEFVNPANSVKDRPALAMILDAERSGQLQPGSVIVEATSGNMGISLAMIAAVRGYRCILVMPEDMSMERRYILRAYGADIELTPAQQGMAGAVERARAIVEESELAFMPSQFDNFANPESHSHGTALEIWEQLDGAVDLFVAGVGTGGTLTGVARTLKKKSAEVKVVAVEPAGSPVLSGGQPGLHGIQGLGAGFIPRVLERALIDEVVQVSDVAAEKMARQIAQTSGLLVGPSSGANVHAAVELAKQLPAGKNVVTVLCDSGERYLF